MPSTARRLRYAILLGCSLLGIGLGGPAGFAQQRVGVNSAVNPDALGIPPGGLPRRLVLGQDVVFNERITTEAAGQTQVLFVDESTLTIGPNANMVIDQFVYDPSAGAGKLVASLGRGVFRFVGGKLSKQENAVTMRTPTATIGIRGGVMLVDQDANGRLEVIFVFGKGVTVTGLNGVSQTITRPGFEVTVSGPGAAPSDPGPAPRGRSAALLAQLDGRAGGNGGAPTTPTEVTVANSGIANAISANVQASVQAAAGTQRQQAQPGNVNPVVQQAQLNNQNATFAAATGIPTNGGAAVSLSDFLTNPTASGSAIVNPNQPQNTPIAASGTGMGQATSSGNGGMAAGAGGNTQTAMGPEMGPPETGPSPPPPQTYAGNFKSTNGFGTTAGLLDAGGTTSNGIAYSGGTLSFPPNSPQNGVFTAALGGAGQLTIPLPPGAANLPANGAGTSSPAGPVTGTTYLSPDGAFFYANLTPVNAPAQREFIYGGQPVNSSFYQATGATRILAFNLQPDAALQSNIPFIRNQAGGNLPNAVVSPYYVVAPANVAFGDNITNADRTTTMQASLAISGQGAGQQSVIVVQTGQFFQASDGSVAVTGLVRGSARLNPPSPPATTPPPVRIASSVANVIDGSGNRIYGGNAISGFVLHQNGYNFNSQYVPNQLAQENVLASPSTISTSYGFNQPATPTNVPAGVGAPGSRATQTLTGFFGGLQQTRTAANGVSPPPYVVIGGAEISTNASTNRVSATLAGVDPFTSSTSGVTSEVLNFGSTSGLYAARSAFVDNSHFAAVESPYNPAATTPSQQGLAPVIFNGKVLTFNGDPGQAGQLYLVSSGAVPSTALLPPGVSYCQCQYLQWGYWGGDIRGGTTADNTVRERAHINTWVAGSLTPLAEINTLAMQGAVGNYNGHLIGSVFNNGSQYLAAGGLKAAYNFGTQIGSFQVINYDGISFKQTGRLPLTPGPQPVYGFNITQPGLKGDVLGAFYGPNATETGGTFAFQKTVGLPYSTAGIFAASGPILRPP